MKRPTASTPYHLHQGLQVCVFPGSIQIGKMPPTAHVIEDPPDFLAAVLQRACTPTPRDELVAHARRLGGLDDRDARMLVGQLIDAGILVSRWVDVGQRYSRHDLYYSLAFGAEVTSSALASMTVAIVGVGGIGTNTGLQLAAAGVGRLILVDGDTVEPSNLTRQYLFTEADVGRLKVEAAAQALSALNSTTRVDIQPRAVSGRDDLRCILAGADLAIVSADDPPGLGAWVDDVAPSTGTPFSVAGYQDGVGIVGPLVVPGVTGCLECFERSAQPATRRNVGFGISNVNARYQAPSFGPLNAVVAGIQATEALRYLLTGQARSMNARIAFDSLSMETLRHAFDPRGDCARCRRVRPVVRTDGCEGG